MIYEGLLGLSKQQLCTRAARWHLLASKRAWCTGVEAAKKEEQGRYTPDDVERLRHTLGMCGLSVDDFDTGYLLYAYASTTADPTRD